MNDQDKREKVINGLECLAKQHGIVGVCEPENCPYGDLLTCANEIARDALALLKAQEPVEPVFDAGDGKTIGQFLCGKCHAKIGFGHPHFCWYCGRAVKWE